jgi:MFS family permease
MSINAVFSLAAAFVRVGYSPHTTFDPAHIILQQRIALCVLRAFAGAGQAIAMPAAFGIVGVSFIDEYERTVAFALMGMGFPVGGALGQVIGGVIAGAGT